MDSPKEQLYLQEGAGEFPENHIKTADSDQRWTSRNCRAMVSIFEEACVLWNWYEGERVGI